MLSRFSRLGQMYGVLTLAFGVSVVGSLLVLSGVASLGVAPAGRIYWQILFEILCLCLLYLILRSQQRGLRSIGFSPAARFTDVWHSVLLFFGAMLASSVVYALIALLHQLLFRTPLRPWEGAAALFGNSGSFLPLVLVFVNPFFEELLVRAYFMTEIEQHFGRAWLAITLSVALQASYHLYQGLPNAVGLAAMFVCFAVYFSRTRRILPVILAHLYFDVLALAAYLR